MTNVIALWIGAILITIFAVDWFALESQILITVMRILLSFIERLAFWR